MTSPTGRAKALVMHGCEVQEGEALDALDACGEPARPYLLNGHKRVWCCDRHAAIFGPALTPPRPLAR